MRTRFFTVVVSEECWEQTKKSNCKCFKWKCVCVYNAVSTNAILNFIYSGTFKISNLKTKLLFNKVYLGGQWDQLVVAGADEAKVQFCRKAGNVLPREGYNSKKFRDLDMSDNPGHSWTYNSCHWREYSPSK